MSTTEVSLDDEQIDDKRKADAYDRKAIMASIIFASIIRADIKDTNDLSNLPTGEEVFKQYQGAISFATRVAHYLHSETVPVE